jgi:phosphatidylglycerol:prolipoprotein diacylglycerol transferase
VHPVLFEIPMPSWPVPLGPALLACALVALAVAAHGKRSSAKDLVAIGLLGALVAGFLAVRLWGEHAVLGAIPIYSFGAMLCAALITGWVIATRLARREHLSHDVITGAYLATGVGGFLGARLLYVLTNLSDFHSLEGALAFRSGGLVFYGAVLGGWAASLWYLRGKSVPFVVWADIAAPSVAAGAFLGRIGCYLAGCDYGVPLGASAPRWLARVGTFPRWPDDVAGPGAGSPAWVDHVLTRGLALDSRASLPVHPTQLYESFALGLLVLLLLVSFGRRHFRGQIFLTFVMGYGAVRFLIETLRDDPERRLFGPAGAPRFVWAFGALLLAVGFAVGPSRSIASPSQRLVARAAAFTVPVLVAVLAWGKAAPIALSTSQWIAVLTSLALVPLWRRLSKSPAVGPAEPVSAGG